jgi:hypothetical protein
MPARSAERALPHRASAAWRRKALPTDYGDFDVHILSVGERVPIEIPPSDSTRRYLKMK